MTQVIRYFSILLAGVLIGLALTVQRDVLADRKADLQPLPLDQLQTFAEIFGKIKSDYVEDVDDKKLIEYAIQGMLAGLDPHSAYLTPESYNEVRIGTEGQFGGLGIEVTMENGFVKVISPIDDTPAQRAGLKPNDLIVRIDDAQVKGMTLADAVKLMRGKPGTEIRLTVVRDGTNRPLKVTITRAVIKIQSVKSRVLEEGYGYVRITQFQTNTGNALREHLSKLKKKKGGLKGLVLDLRNNPGGLLNAAVAVSDTFLSKGKIVYTEGRHKESQLKFNATPNNYVDDAPIVVLVNEGSASASEIVAGALQDHHRAVIMGTKTFGKGSVQTILPMRNHAALKITTARYYTPKGRSIQATGIVPDVVVKPLKISEEEDRGQRVREADLARHLENENGEDEGESKGETKKNEAKNKAASDREALEKDYQLTQALNLLKGVNIVRASSNYMP